MSAPVYDCIWFCSCAGVRQAENKKPRRFAPAGFLEIGWIQRARYRATLVTFTTTTATSTSPTDAFRESNRADIGVFIVSCGNNR